MTKSRKEEASTQDFSRRDFIKSTGLAAGLMGGLAHSSNVLTTDASNSSGNPGKNLPLKVTGYDFDRLAALAEGKACS
jgi:hypothetical protein